MLGMLPLLTSLMDLVVLGQNPIHGPPVTEVNPFIQQGKTRRTVQRQYVINHIGGYINGRIKNLNDLQAGDEVIIDLPSSISSDAIEVISVLHALVHRGVKVSFVEPECTFSPHAFCDTDSLGDNLGDTGNDYCGPGNFNSGHYISTVSKHKVSGYLAI